MNELIKEIEDRLGYTYKHSKGLIHVFVKHYMRQPKPHHLHFVETTCSICNGPYMKRRWGKATSHGECSRAINKKFNRNLK